MIKLTVLYNFPGAEVVDAFREHYLNVHDPLVRALPNLERFDVAFTTPGQDGAPAPYFLIAELYFKDFDAMAAAMASAEGQAVAADNPNVLPYVATAFASVLV